MDQDVRSFADSGLADSDRYDRLMADVRNVCSDVGLVLKPEQYSSMTRVLYDGHCESGRVNRKELRRTLLKLSLEG